MKVEEVLEQLDNWAPPALQESYDNAGLLCGDKTTELTSAIVCLDVTEEVIAEAISSGANLIIAHHPIIFSGLKRLTGSNYVERTIIKAIQNNISIYAIHTNLDNISTGVNKIIGDKLGIDKTQILLPKQGLIKKLVCYCPTNKSEEFRKALFDAGAGHIGNYDQCSFNTEGEGSFRALENSHPYVGKKGQIHFEKEQKIEVVFDAHLEYKIIKTLHENHPYEEVAYEIYQTENRHPYLGAGMIGVLSKEMELGDFLAHLKDKFDLKIIRHTNSLNRQIKRVAWCGGAGSFLLKDAIKQKADMFITGDFKYHEFFDAENQIVIADIGHYESEQYTMELIAAFLKRKFPKFAVRLTRVNTNPVNYF